MELFKNSIQKIPLFFNNILIGIALYTLTIQNIQFWDKTQIYDSLPFLHVLLTFLLILSTIKITLLLSDYLHIYTFNKENFSFLIVKPVIRGLLLILTVNFISTIFLFMENHFSTTNQTELEKTFSNMPLFLIFFMTVISGPIMEEILCRGFLIGVCFKHNSILALLFSSLLFGLAHKPTDIGSFTLYVGTGLVLGILFQQTKKLEVCILIHAANNLLGLITYMI